MAPMWRPSFREPRRSHRTREDDGARDASTRVRPSSLRATRAQLEVELAVLIPFLAEAELDLDVTVAGRL